MVDLLKSTEMIEDDKKEVIHHFPVNEEGKGKKLKLQVDPENPESKHMAELFTEVAASNPESLQEFFIRLNEINKLKL